MHAEGDRLVVTFRPVREPGAILFMLLFSPLWTFGGIAVIVGLFDASWGDRPFMLFWLCGWAVAEAGLIVALAWLFRGRELLIVTPEQFEVRKQVGRFARTKVYDATRIQTVEAALVPSDDEGPERKDFCLKLINEDASVQVGEGMTEAEADDAAAVVRELIRPRRWWGEETEEPWKFPLLFREGAAKQSRRGLLVLAAVFAVLAVTTAIGFLYGSDGDKSGEPSPRPTAGSRGCAVPRVRVCERACRGGLGGTHPARIGEVRRRHGDAALGLHCARHRLDRKTGALPLRGRSRRNSVRPCFYCRASTSTKRSCARRAHQYESGCPFCNTVKT